MNFLAGFAVFPNATTTARLANGTSDELVYFIAQSFAKLTKNTVSIVLLTVGLVSAFTV